MNILRSIVAGPRARHAEAGLDLCYVTDFIIATSGPSGTYPQRAYRNPLESLRDFLDSKHGEDWAIWEFRAEGTGYPDSEVYNRVYHYPFPDHHPPPFALIPNIMASMRNWLREKEGRVVVVHCKAGKGRSGTASCSYLISEEGWPVEKALQRFTERRMRPNMGKGVSIPSQLRWIGYVDRWAKTGKLYVERQIEILEVHCWDLRDGVKIQIEGFVDDGKTIKNFHTFTREEREIVRGEVKTTSVTQAVQEVMYKNGLGRSEAKGPAPASDAKATGETTTSNGTSQAPDRNAALDGAGASKAAADLNELGTGDVVFRPTKRVILPTNDINVDIERRNKAAFDLTMVTAVAHVWFNAFFEGNGPEKNGTADDSGVFEIGWDAMDGIKGSSRRGTQAFAKIAILWKAYKPDGSQPGVVITEPKEGEHVAQSGPVDWKGRQGAAPEEDRDLGLRAASPGGTNGNLSTASSLHHADIKNVVKHAGRTSQEDHTVGVKSHGPEGEADIKSPYSAGKAAPDTRFAPSAAAQQVDGSSAEGAGDTTVGLQHSDTMQSTGSEGIVTGAQHVHTDNLPDGRPEAQMKTVKEHVIGHLSKQHYEGSS